MTSALRSFAALGCALALVACVEPPHREELPEYMGPPIEPLDWLADPAGRARALPGRAHLVSSRQPEAPDGDGNADFNRFESTSSGQSVLFDVTGPGVITRIWLTMTTGADRTISNVQRLHLVIDGAEVEIGDAEPGVLIGDLTSGELEAFPHPFVADPSRASGAQLVMLPIAFQRSARITIDATDIQTYYQIDWRELPSGTPLESFTGTWSSAQRELLDRAADVWNGVHRADTFVDEELAPGETLRVEGGTLVERIRISSVADERVDPEIEIRADGELVFRGDPAQWAGGRAIPMAFESAGIAIDEDGAELSYPIAVASELEIENLSATSIAVEVEHGAHDAPASLRRLRVLCEHAGSTTDHRLRSAEVRGIAGHFAGVSALVDGVEAGWQMMEGDHELEVDGEWAILGTGAEDFFGGAYYFQDGAFALPTAGAPAFDLHGFSHLRAGDVDVAVYRNLFLDRVDFADSFVFALENYVEGTTLDTCVFVYVDR